jgi:hypothetical protein
MERPPYADFLNSNNFEQGGNHFYVENSNLFDDIGHAGEVQSRQATTVSDGELTTNLKREKGTLLTLYIL